jgi:outer membrane biogenesis lipoprotein LolB
MRLTAGPNRHTGVSRHRREVLLALAAASLAGACAAPEPALRRKALGEPIAPTQWSGRFSAVYSVPGAQPDEQSASGRFRLEQAEGETRLELLAPTGQTIALARANASGAELTDNRGQLHRARSAELLTEQLFGWRIPVLALAQWLQGKVAEPAESVDGRIRSGSESGWQIRFDSWFDEGLAKSLELSWPGPTIRAERRIRLRLVVDKVS